MGEQPRRQQQHRLLLRVQRLLRVLAEEVLAEVLAEALAQAPPTKAAQSLCLLPQQAGCRCRIACLRGAMAVAMCRGHGIDHSIALTSMAGATAMLDN